MADDLVPLLIALALIGLGLVLSRSRISQLAARRHDRRVDRRVEKLSGQGRDDAAFALLAHETDRLRQNTTSDLRRLRLAHLLQKCALHHQLAGRLDAALPYAHESVGIVDGLAGRYPEHVVLTNVTLGQVLAGLGDDEAAIMPLRLAYAHVRANTTHGPERDAERVFVAANLSMVLRRITAVDEAIDVARWAIAVDQGIAPGTQPPFTLAGAGWAHAALALAQTDGGQDGRQAASDAQRIWNTLTDNGVFSEHESDGPAYADFAMAYAVQTFDSAAAAELARNALARLEHLHARFPGRHDRRLAEARALLLAVT